MTADEIPRFPRMKITPLGDGGEPTGQSVEIACSQAHITVPHEDFDKGYEEGLIVNASVWNEVQTSFSYAAEEVRAFINHLYRLGVQLSIHNGQCDWCGKPSSKMKRHLNSCKARRHRPYSVAPGKVIR